MHNLSSVVECSSIMLFRGEKDRHETDRYRQKVEHQHQNPEALRKPGTGSPPVPRAANGYRVYTEEHVAYFECIRAMIPGFGIPITREVVRKLQKQEVDEALWLVNEQQALLHREKV